jgi:hypothetical protein
MTPLSSAMEKIKIIWDERLHLPRQSQLVRQVLTAKEQEGEPRGDGYSPCEGRTSEKTQRMRHRRKLLDRSDVDFLDKDHDLGKRERERGCLIKDMEQGKPPFETRKDERSQDASSTR